VDPNQPSTLGFSQKILMDVHSLEEERKELGGKEDWSYAGRNVDTRELSSGPGHRGTTGTEADQTGIA